jgi:hypothetical protein
MVFYGIGAHHPGGQFVADGIETNLGISHRIKKDGEGRKALFGRSPVKSQRTFVFFRVYRTRQRGAPIVVSLVDAPETR